MMGTANFFMPIYDGLREFISINQSENTDKPDKPELKYQYLAGLVEAIELLDELPWKWWKRYDSYQFNVYKFEEEVADILLFLTSGMMIISKDPIQYFNRLYDVFMDMDNNSDVNAINDFLYSVIAKKNHSINTQDRLFIYDVFTEYIQKILQISDADDYLYISAYTMSAFFMPEDKPFRILSCVVYKNTKNIYRIIQGRNKGMLDKRQLYTRFIYHAIDQIDVLKSIRPNPQDSTYIEKMYNMISQTERLVENSKQTQKG